jgi:hypothetical protein
VLDRPGRGAKGRPQHSQRQTTDPSPPFPRPCTDTLFDSCEAPTYGLGGAIYQGGGTLTCTRCDFTRNTADFGGAHCLAFGGSAVFVKSSFVSNAARTSGGALAVSRSSLALERSLMRGNSVASSGGASAVYCFGCALRATGAIFAANTGPAGCVALGVANPDAVALNPVIESTTFVDNGPSVRFANSLAGGKGTITNSILWNSGGGGGGELGYFSAAQVSVSYSVWRGAPSSPCTSAPCGAGVIADDPQLAELAIALPLGVRGPDRYWAPAAGSPAIGAGVNAGGAAEDFLGHPRVCGGAGRDRMERNLWAWVTGPGVAPTIGGLPIDALAPAAETRSHPTGASYPPAPTHPAPPSDPTLQLFLVPTPVR